MNSSHRLALAAPLLLLLAACGAKGPLILPEKAAPIEAPAEAVPEAAVPIDETSTTPADQQAEEAVDDPAPPAEND
jgi:predicted small lipoprotein YifL